MLRWLGCDACAAVGGACASGADRDPAVSRRQRVLLLQGRCGTPRPRPVDRLAASEDSGRGRAGAFFAGTATLALRTRPRSAWRGSQLPSPRFWIPAAWAPDRQQTTIESKYVGQKNRFRRFRLDAEHTAQSLALYVAGGPARPEDARGLGDRLPGRRQADADRRALFLQMGDRRAGRRPGRRRRCRPSCWRR